MPTRQVILLPPAGDDADESDAPATVFGSAADVLELLSPYNISPDGSGPDGLGDSPGMATLYGPGMIAEFSQTGDDDVKQLLLTLTDEDFAWPAIFKLCNATGCRMMDPATGRTFG